MTDDRQPWRQRSWWLESLDQPIIPNPPLQGSVKADVVVVGGGFMGLSTAYNLKQLEPSLDVVLLESQVCGFGASGRNGGFAMTLFGLTKEVTQLRFGRSRAEQAHRYMEEGVDYLADLVAQHDMQCDFERSGYLLIATRNKNQRQRLAKEFEVFHSWKTRHPVEHWDRSRLASEFETEAYEEGWYEPRCAILQPAKLAREFKRIAEAAGVRIHETSTVTGFDRDAAQDFIVSTAAGSVHAKRLVLATNAYSQAFPQIRLRQTPAFTHIVLSEPLSDAQMASINWRCRAGVEDSLNFIHYYRLTADNRIVMGGGDVTVPFGSNLELDHNERVFRHLEAHLIEVFPQLRGLRFTHRWGGPVSITVDLAPAIGFIGADRRAVYSIGCVGHGVGLTPQNGRTIAELLTGRETERTNAFFVGRKTIPWPPEPLRFVMGQMIRGGMLAGDALLYR